MAIISTFIIALLFALVRIGFGGFHGTLGQDNLIPVFTTAVWFLAGVLAPGPVSSSNKP